LLFEEENMITALIIGVMAGMFSFIVAVFAAMLYRGNYDDM